MSRRPMTAKDKAEQDRFFASFTVQRIVPPTGTARTPSVAKLIHLLIEERAKCIGLYRHAFFKPQWTQDQCRDQARREIEQEVLCPK
jgi:hypothetical protein